MKINELKKLVKSAVKEAIQEELKEILLEAVRAPKQTVVENIQPQKVVEGPVMSSKEKRAAYQNILGDTAAAFTTNNVPQSFSPQPNFDSANGVNPEGTSQTLICGSIPACKLPAINISSF